MDELQKLASSIKNQEYPPFLRRAKDNTSKQMKLGETMKQERKCEYCKKLLPNGKDYGKLGTVVYCNEDCYNKDINKKQNCEVKKCLEEKKLKKKTKM